MAGFISFTSQGLEDIKKEKEKLSPEENPEIKFPYLLRMDFLRM